MSLPCFVLGGGRVGRALGLGLREAAVPITGLWTRSESSAREATARVELEWSHGALPETIAAARVVILAVTDEVVPSLCGALLDAGLLRSRPVLLHCGGARPARIALAPVAGQLPVGTLHPLLAVVDAARTVAALRAGALLAVEGDPEARAAGVAIGRALGAEALELPAEAMARYHLAAVFTSNHLLGLLAVASELLGELGLSPERARSALLPLLRSTVENLSPETELAASLTGPVRRGDLQTVARHLELLEGAPERDALYRSASLELVRLARFQAPPELGAALDQLVALLRGPGPSR